MKASGNPNRAYIAEQIPLFLSGFVVTFFLVSVFYWLPFSQNLFFARKVLRSQLSIALTSNFYTMVKIYIEYWCVL